MGTFMLPRLSLMQGKGGGFCGVGPMSLIVKLMIWPRDGLAFRQVFCLTFIYLFVCLFVCLYLIKCGLYFFQTIPRMVWLDENGKQLVQWPITELESLRRKRVQFHNREVKTGGLLNIKGVKASQVSTKLCLK